MMKNRVNNTQAHRIARQAFTLVEILLVLALLLVISSVAFPSITRWQRTMELDHNTQQVCEFLQKSRLHAIGQALPVHVEVDYSRNELRRKRLWNSTLAENHSSIVACKLAEGFEFQVEVRDAGEQLECDSHLVFHADGTSANALISIMERHSGDVRLVKTSRLTGSVRIVE